MYRAYQELWALGYLESRPGSYSTVRKRAVIASVGTRTEPSPMRWEDRGNPAVEILKTANRKDEALIERAAGSDAINFIPLSPDSRLFPVDAFRKCMNEVLVKDGRTVLQYGRPQGHEPLRDFIAQRMRGHGVRVSADEIMITTGAQNAVELLLRLLAGPGSSVAVEAPTYSRVIEILHLSGVRIDEIPMLPDGMDLDTLEDLVKKRPPAMIYTIPNFHNPTGITTDQAHRERLLNICTKHAAPLLEDGFEEEMKYFGKAVLPIKSMDRSGAAVYIGTFSKILFPALRIGWIAADKACIERLIPIQKASIISGNVLDQAALNRFCRLGHYELHVKRMHRIYRKRMHCTMKAMQTRILDDRIRWTRPSGGYTIWLRLEGLDIREEKAADVLFEHGAAVLPGGPHFHGPFQGLHFRLSIAHLDEQAIEEGIRRIEKGLDTLYEKYAAQP